jgi:Flp pilus assembly secretin CpaC
MNSVSTQVGRLLRPIAAATTIAAVFAGATVPAKAADDLLVKYDQSKLVRLQKPAAEIIVGNPSIADVSVQSGNLLVVTGKSFGITNIIILDAERNVIQDQRVMVQRDEGKVVNLMRGVDRQSYNCSPQCNPSITVGDEQKYFDAIRNASQTKKDFSEGAGDKGGQQGQ